LQPNIKHAYQAHAHVGDMGGTGAGEEKEINEGDDISNNNINRCNNIDVLMYLSSIDG